jgi:hypothetical protein
VVDFGVDFNCCKILLAINGRAWDTFLAVLETVLAFPGAAKTELP